MNPLRMRVVLSLLGVFSLATPLALMARAQQPQAAQVQPLKPSVTTKIGAIHNLPVSTKCLEVSSSGYTSCKDAGGYDSVCATASCPAGYTLTGGGGSCSAGDRKIKSLFPRFSQGEFAITCESQGALLKYRPSAASSEPRRTGHHRASLT